MMSNEKINEALKNLSEEERELAINILKQMATEGQSAIFDDLKYSDFEEIPVNINTFLDDDRYLGRGLWEVDQFTGERKCTVFPYWREVLKKLFPDNITTAYNTLILTGCLSYNTPIPLLNGKVENIGDLAKIGNLDEYVYSYDIETNSYVPGHLTKAFSTGIKPVYEITLDNGQKIKATSNHKFMTRNKHWKSIDTGLTIGDSMMPFNTTSGSIAGRAGYEIIKNPNKDGTSTDIFTHRMVMSWKLGGYSGVVHHKDYNKLNNDPRNLQVMTWQAHKMFHAKRGGMQWQAFNEKRRIGLIDKDIEQKIRQGGLLGNKNRWADKNEHKKMSILTTNRMNTGLAKEMANIVWNGQNAETNRQKVRKNIIMANTDPQKIAQYQISKAIKIGNLAIKDFGELTKETYEQTKIKYNMRSGYPSFEAILNRISLHELIEQATAYNHKIIKIEYIGNEEVYDLTVEKYHNFAIKDGIVAHNSIGIGKSFVGVLAMLYLLYRMLCLKDPYAYYGMQPIDKITFSMLNITLDAAQGVAWDKAQQLIQKSDWFMTHGELNMSRTNPQWQPPKGIELIFGSNNRHIVGRCLFANLTDEVNFGIGNDVEKKKEKQRKMISQIDARMRSRFLRGTFLPTLNIIISSKDTEQAFLNTYIELKKKNESKTSLIVDEPQWVVDKRKGSPDDQGSFWVAVGGKTLAHELLPLEATDEVVQNYRHKGYQMLKVPPGYREAFEDNLDQALMDIAGISTSSMTKFIAGDRILFAKIDTYQNPFTKDVIEVGNNPEDHYQYANFFDLSKITPEDKARPMFIHLDMSTGAGGKGDKTGIAGVWITGKQPTEAGNPDSSRDLRYKLAFSVSIKAPKGYQISFEKNRNFIRWLRDQGFAIKKISSDTFQSATLQQELKSDGFNTEIVSVDRVDATSRTCLPYQYLKSAIYERKIEIYRKCDLLTDELIGLERKADGHIDHTPDGINCLSGDTKISLVDGRELTMLELLEEFKNGKINYVYSINENTLKIEPKPIINVFKSGTAEKLLKITLDNNESIICTPEHRFMLRNGNYCMAKDLIHNDSLMPLYRKYPTEVVAMKDYRMYYEPIEDKWHYEHRQFATEVLDEKYLVHHKNCNKNDNSPTNLLWCSKAAHIQIHNKLQTGAQSPEANAKRKLSITNWHAMHKNDLEYVLAHNHSLTAQEFDEYLIKKQMMLEHDQNIAKAVQEIFGLDYNNLSKDEKAHYCRTYYYLQNNYNIGARQQAKDKHAKIRQEIIETFKINYDELTDNEKQSYAIKLARLKDPTYQEKVSKAVSNNHKLGKYKNAAIALQKNNAQLKQLKALFPTIDPVKFKELFGFEYTKVDKAHAGVWTNRYRQKMYELYNHKVKSIESIDIPTDVYDLTIADNHNFALTAGIFVHNSKDQADAVCGALFLASKFAEEYSYQYGDNLTASLDASLDQTENYTKEQIIVNFQEELAKLYKEQNECITKEKQEEAKILAEIADGIIII